MATSTSENGWAGGVLGRVLLCLLPAMIALAGLWAALAAQTALAAPLVDEAPAVAGVNPRPEARGVALDVSLDGSLAVTFTEAVSLTGALELACERSGRHDLAVGGGPVAFSFLSDRALLPGEACLATVLAAGVSDQDGDDPPDQPLSDTVWSFRAAAKPVVINELDAITPDGAAEFIELYDGGRGDTDLSGLSLVLYRGDEASVYLAVGLDGYRTDGAGYFVVGASGVVGVDLRLADGTLRDGPDAVAIYDAAEDEFPRNEPVRTEDLVDAAVYGPAEAALLALLSAGQEPLDEDSRGAAEIDSSQRCPNGGGQPRETEVFLQREGTPGEENRCRAADDPPVVSAVSPAPNEDDVAVDAELEVNFSEPVELQNHPLEVYCEQSGDHSYTVEGDGDAYRFIPHSAFVRGETCVVTVLAERIRDGDDDDPPDNLTADYVWSFHTIPLVADHVVINEIDPDTPGVDSAEFIELFDGGAGHTSLNGLSLVLFNGADDRSYFSIDLEGYSTDSLGYFLLANGGVAGGDAVLPDGVLQNGPDAAVLAVGSAADFPNGTPVTATVPLDAIVYSRPTQNDAGLQPLLNAGQPQVDESGRGNADGHSMQRCPNGGGGQRNTAGYKPNTPTPGAINDCITDIGPLVTATSPTHSANGITIYSTIAVTFNEPVAVKRKWASLKCATSGTHAYRTSGGPTVFVIEPESPLAYSEQCTVTIAAGLVTDLDTDDPPDVMQGNVSWSFTTAAAPADFIVINEIDTDTPSTDTAEFIELFDGGAGNTSLNGLALVWFNGSTNRSYRAIDLDGLKTDSRGYFVTGNTAVNPGLIFPNGGLQNGPDAVALYAGDATQFPTESPITTQGLIDAIVYGDPTAVPPELLALLLAGQGPANEDGRGAADLHSLQRCPNGSGGQRRTASFLPNTPTPGKESDCITDIPPQIAGVSPAHGTQGASIYTSLSITFNEPVTLSAGALRLFCETGGERAITISGGPETFSAAPTQPLLYNDACEARLTASLISDLDSTDPPDHPQGDFEWSFTTSAPPADFILINEVDSDTPGSDTAEFIELYDGGRGQTDLSGLVIVLYNGNDDRSYLALDLDNAQTDAAGYLVIGNSGLQESDVTLSTGVLQNGADAVALYAGDATSFPNGTLQHTRGLHDAVVYGTGDPEDIGLLPLLADGQSQVEENGRGTADLDSSGRCPDGAGGQRYTTAFRADAPSPGRANNCTLDDAPEVMDVVPPPMATDLAKETVISVTFSEDVVVQSGWFSIACGKSGTHAATVGGGPRQFTLTPTSPFAPQETCEVTLRAATIADADADDPPDHPLNDYKWTFTTAADPPDFVLINEIDADTPGSDTLEFIELYDGGVGETELSGLVVVFWNGSGDAAYRAIDLQDQRTNEAGYFVLGNAALASADLVFANGGLQNGPDAIGLYAGRPADFAVGAPLRVAGLIDAIVYGPADEADADLLPLVDDGQPQVDENGRDAGDVHSLQRCPNGAGGLRRTETYRPNPTTPGAPNICTLDEPPTVVAVEPLPDATDVSLDAIMRVTFSEDVAARSGWYSIDCAISGAHAAVVTGGPRQFSLDPLTPFSPDESCTVSLFAAGIADADSDDPPDNPAADFTSSFTTAAAPADFVLINEIDADTPGSDTMEFIELYDGGAGHTHLDGLAVVFWNDKDDTAYRAIDLDGFQTDSEGYFTLGNAGVLADLAFVKGALQNGPDAVVLVIGSAADYPTGTPLTMVGLIDAIVYGPADSPDDELLDLLEPGQPQVDEDARGEGDIHSLQRCPNGAGGARLTQAYRPNVPTPGAPNDCLTDATPLVIAVSPPDGEVGVPAHASITVQFSENVVLDEPWYEIACDQSGLHTATTTGGPVTFALSPTSPFIPDEECTVTVVAATIHDTDTDDPPDTMPADFNWHFRVAAPTATGILINEVDADTPGSDSAEFIELYDGGAGHTDLSGLVIVFWNGKNDQAYRAIDLTGYETDDGGYFVLGNADVAPGLSFGRGTLQNGPDAVALYAEQLAAFPVGLSLTTDGLVDAIVYGPTDSPDEELLILLEPDQPQVDEDDRGDRETHSLQRCPNMAGGPRHTDHVAPSAPTPGAPNDCGPSDAPPAVVSVSPAGGAENVALDAVIRVGFSEDVTVDDDWLTLVCEASGAHPVGVAGGPRLFVLTPAAPFAADEECAARIIAAAVHDADGDDPPDTPAGEFAWRFRAAPPEPPPIAGFSANGPLWIGQTAVFSNTSAGPGPLVYAWDFDDGGVGSAEAQPSHRYAAVGVYTVTLTVSGTTGTAVYSEEIEVRPRMVLLPLAGGGWRPSATLHLALVISDR